VIRRTLERAAIVLFMLGLLACELASIYIAMRGLSSGP
jgi:hypothetical protein